MDSFFKAGISFIAFAVVTAALSFSIGSAQIIDHFPNKISVDYATGFKVEYHGHYKVVHVLKPWRDAKETFQYVLVQRGADIPDGFEEHQIFEVPIKGFVTMSTTHLPHVDILDIHDELLAVSSFKYVNTESIVTRIKEKKLKEVGYGANLDLEMLVDLSPGLVMTNAMGDAQHDIHPKLMELGVPVVLNAEYMENHPLGRAEWMKFTALFFNREAQAQETFGEVARDYQKLAALGRSTKERPTVFTGTSWNGIWHVPGGRSYMAQFLADAGANYMWRDNPETGSLALDIEAVLGRAKDAEFWVNTGQWNSVDDALAVDERHGLFLAMNTGKVFNRNARANENGGNDYWETGIVQPHRLLADLIGIFHPDLLPHHTLIWYQKLHTKKE